MKARKPKRVEARKYLPTLRGVFGDWVYYSCLMPLADVASRIVFAEKIVRRSERLSEWIQRELKRGRAREIAHYLETEDQRFFNSLVVAIHGGSPAWHGFGNFRPEVADIDLRAVPEDVEAVVCFLSFDGTEKIFALDSQHRLAGIQEALQKRPELGRDRVQLGSLNDCFDSSHSVLPFAPVDR